MCLGNPGKTFCWRVSLSILSEIGKRFQHYLRRAAVLGGRSPLARGSQHYLCRELWLEEGVDIFVLRRVDGKLRGILKKFEVLGEYLRRSYFAEEMTDAKDVVDGGDHALAVDDFSQYSVDRRALHS